MKIDSYYQRKKKEYEQTIKNLQSDLDTLVFNPDSVQADFVRQKVAYKKQLEDNIMFGSPLANLTV